MCSVRCSSFYNWVGSCSQSWSCSRALIATRNPSTITHPTELWPLFPSFPLVGTGIRARWCSFVCTECEKLLHTFRPKRDIILYIFLIFLLLLLFSQHSAQSGLTFVRCIEIEAQTQTETIMLGDLVHCCQTKTAILAVGSVKSVSVKAFTSFIHLAKMGVKWFRCAI